MPSAGLLFLPDCAGCCPVRRRNASPGYQADSGNPEDVWTVLIPVLQNSVLPYLHTDRWLPRIFPEQPLLPWSMPPNRRMGRYSMHIFRDVRAVYSSAFPGTVRLLLLHIPGTCPHTVLLQWQPRSHSAVSQGILRYRSRIFFRGLLSFYPDFSHVLFCCISGQIRLHLPVL